MFKVLSGLLVVVLVTVLGFSVAEDPTVCKYTDQLWGGDDPHYFFYCDPTTNKTDTAPCPDTQGYISDEDNQGCVDWLDWSDDCISKTPISAATCVGSGATHPSAYGNPDNFYLCPSAGSVPVKLSCQSGYGFYSGNKYLGCFPWSMWRNITGCVNTI